MALKDKRLIRLTAARREQLEKMIKGLFRAGSVLGVRAGPARTYR
jgi:hypothetical protein